MNRLATLLAALALSACHPPMGSMNVEQPLERTAAPLKLELPSHALAERELDAPQVALAPRGRTSVLTLRTVDIVDEADLFCSVEICPRWGI